MRDTLYARLEEFGDHTAVVHGGTRHSYTQLRERIASYESALREQGVKSNEAVVLHGEFSFESIAALFALAVNQNVVIPVVNLTDGLLASVAESCGPRHIVRASEQLKADPFPHEGPSAPSLGYTALAERGSAGLVLLSSGSTGAPKAVLHDLDALVEQKLRRPARTGAKAPSILMFLLFDHIGGMNSMLGAVLTGSPAVIPAARTPDEICGLVERHRIRVLPTSPTFLNLIIMGGFHHKHDLSSLRLITYGTEPMPHELLRRANEAFPRAKFLQTFGTSETGISTTVSESSQSTSFKIVDPDVRHRVVDGELQLKTKTQFLGYLNYPNAALTDDGWFKTGDLVEESADGYLRVVGRAKEVINVGGEKVLPLELESILLSSPIVEDCAVYGKSNAITGQSVWVDVKSVAGLSVPEVRKHVIEFMAQRVDRFKVPSRVNVVEAVGVSDRFKKRRGR